MTLAWHFCIFVRLYDFINSFIGLQGATATTISASQLQVFFSIHAIRVHYKTLTEREPSTKYTVLFCTIICLCQIFLYLLYDYINSLINSFVALQNAIATQIRCCFRNASVSRCIRRLTYVETIYSSPTAYIRLARGFMGLRVTPRAELPSKFAQVAGFRFWNEMNESAMILSEFENRLRAGLV